MKPWHVSYDDGCNIYHWIVFAFSEQEAKDQVGCSKTEKALNGGMKVSELNQRVTLVACEERRMEDVED